MFLWRLIWSWDMDFRKKGAFLPPSPLPWALSAFMFAQYHINSFWSAKTQQQLKKQAQKDSKIPQRKTNWEELYTPFSRTIVNLKGGYRPHMSQKVGLWEWKGGEEQKAMTENWFSPRREMKRNCPQEKTQKTETEKKSLTRSCSDLQIRHSSRQHTPLSWDGLGFIPRSYLKRGPHWCPPQGSQRSRGLQGRKGDKRQTVSYLTSLGRTAAGIKPQSSRRRRRRRRAEKGRGRADTGSVSWEKVVPHTKHVWVCWCCAERDLNATFSLKYKDVSSSSCHLWRVLDLYVLEVRAHKKSSVLDAEST